MNTVQDKNTDSIDSAIVDSIVRRVMDRLSELNIDSPNSCSNQSISAPDAETTEAGNAKPTLELTGKVITLELLRGKLAGTKKIVVQQGAIVTPAVIDELKERGVELETKISVQNKGQKDSRFCLARLSSHYVPVDWLKEAGLGEICCGDTYLEIGDKLGQEKSDCKTVCFAAQPFVAVATLNRQNSLRAAYARSEKEVIEINSTLSANVLVLDSVQPRQELLKLIRVFIDSRTVQRSSSTRIGGAK